MERISQHLLHVYCTIHSNIQASFAFLHACKENLREQIFVPISALKEEVLQWKTGH